VFVIRHHGAVTSLHNSLVSPTHLTLHTHTHHTPYLQQDTPCLNHKDLHLRPPSLPKTRPATPGTALLLRDLLLAIIIITSSHGGLHRFPLPEKQHPDAARLLRATDHPRELHGPSLFEARLDSHDAGMSVSMLVCLGEGVHAYAPTFSLSLSSSFRSV